MTATLTRMVTDPAAADGPDVPYEVLHTLLTNGEVTAELLPQPVADRVLVDLPDLLRSGRTFLAGALLPAAARAASQHAVDAAFAACADPQGLSHAAAYKLLVNDAGRRFTDAAVPVPTAVASVCLFGLLTADHDLSDGLVARLVDALPDIMDNASGWVDADVVFGTDVGYDFPTDHADRVHPALVDRFAEEFTVADDGTVGPWLRWSRNRTDHDSRVVRLADEGRLPIDVFPDVFFTVTADTVAHLSDLGTTDTLIAALTERRLPAARVAVALDDRRKTVRAAAAVALDLTDPDNSEHVAPMNKTTRRDLLASHRPIHPDVIDALLPDDDPTTATAVVRRLENQPGRPAPHPTTLVRVADMLRDADKTGVLRDLLFAHPQLPVDAIVAVGPVDQQVPGEKRIFNADGWEETVGALTVSDRNRLTRLWLDRYGWDDAMCKALLRFIGARGLRQLRQAHDQQNDRRRWTSQSRQPFLRSHGADLAANPNLPDDLYAEVRALADRVLTGGLVGNTVVENLAANPLTEDHDFLRSCSEDHPQHVMVNPNTPTDLVIDLLPAWEQAHRGQPLDRFRRFVAATSDTTVLSALLNVDLPDPAWDVLLAADLPDEVRAAATLMRS